MVQTIYIDLLFLINFSMDFFCFFLVSRLFSKHLYLGRTLLASMLGGFYGIFALFLPFRGILLLISDFLICVCMCLIANARRGMRFRGFMHEAIVYTGVSLLLGGVMTAVYSVLNDSGMRDALSGESESISGFMFLLLALLGGAATLLGGKLCVKKASSEYASVRVTLCGKSAVFRAMVDTGNTLCDPINGMPAAALDKEAATALLPNDLMQFFDNPSECLCHLPEVYRTRARLLPVKTVTGNGLLLAFRPDECYVASEEEGARNGVRCDLLLAIAPITSVDAEMLLPTGITKA